MRHEFISCLEGTNACYQLSYEYTPYFSYNVAVELKNSQSAYASPTAAKWPLVQ